MSKALNEIMEFDYVIQVHADGSITEPKDIHAPEVGIFCDHWGQVHARHEREMMQFVQRQGWELMIGYTGQHGYRGPLMHPSEFIGGAMERDIRATPGYYVAVTVETIDSDDDDDSEPVGWAVAYREVTE